MIGGCGRCSGFGVSPPKPFQRATGTTGFEPSEISKGDDIAAVWPVHFETARRGGRGAAIADIGAEDAELQAIVAVKRVETATVVMHLSPVPLLTIARTAILALSESPLQQRFQVQSPLQGEDIGVPMWARQAARLVFRQATRPRRTEDLTRSPAASSATPASRGTTRATCSASQRSFSEQLPATGSDSANRRGT